MGSKENISTLARGAFPLLNRRQFLALSAMAATAASLSGMTACAPTTVAQTGTSEGFKAGTYTAEAMGKKDNVTVEVTFSDTAIESVEVVSSQETPRIAAVPFERIPEQIVELQSLNIDVVTGATLASMAVLNAVKDCVGQAGGNVKALEGADAMPKSTDMVELDADIVIAGAGAAGLGCAFEAAMNGAKVVVLEKCANIGGNMLVSGGVLTYINAPDELRQEMNDGYRSYFDQTLEKALAMGAPVERIEAIRKQYDDYYASGKTTVFDSNEWEAVYDIISSGAVEYTEEAFEGGIAYAEYDNGLMDWLEQFDVGYKKLIPVAGYPWPNNVSPSTGECGEGWCAAFDRFNAESNLPLEFVFSTPVTELITDENGRVCGMKGQCQDGTTYVVRAGKAVVLATGGFAGDTDLIIEHDDEWGFAGMGLASIPTTNNYGHTGDGLKLALSVGGAYTDAAPNYMVLPFANAVDCSVESIVGDSGNSLLVNREGMRFVDETLSRNEISKAQMAQTDQMCFLISDKNNSGIVDGLNMFGTDVQQMLDNGKLFKADTLEELAEIIEIDPATLVQTVASYNEIAQSGIDTEFGRTLFNEASPVVEGPFYADPCHWAMHITTAGVSTSEENFAVLDEAGNEIGGLYAIGEIAPTGGGIDVMGYGVSLADYLTA